MLSANRRFSGAAREFRDTWRAMHRPRSRNAAAGPPRSPTRGPTGTPQQRQAPGGAPRLREQGAPIGNVEAPARYRDQGRADVVSQEPPRLRQHAAPTPSAASHSLPRLDRSEAVSQRQRAAAAAELPPERQRRSLSHVGGEIEFEGGSERDHDLLQNALQVSADEETTRPHVHGFHPYPARLHPATATALVRGLSPEGGTILDPFAGSGTVVCEARIAGRRALGLDANPFAVELALLKAQGIAGGGSATLEDAAQTVAACAQERRLARSGPSKRYSPYLARSFDSHVLLELDGLSVGITGLSEPTLQRALRLVMSAILTKVSRKRSETSERESLRRIAAGFTTKLFLAKSRELASQLRGYEALLPEKTLPAEVRLGDARDIPLGPATVDAIVTSPPYPGVYDYLEHHRLRLAWLDLPASHLEQHEIGAQRHLSGSSPEDAWRLWHEELSAFLQAMSRVLKPGGTAALVIADSVLAGQAWYADREIEELAPRVGLNLDVSASQLRPHFHYATRHAFIRRPRREHVLLLRPVPRNR